MSRKTHYPTYDVMNGKEHWDPHTRQIVMNRLIREHGYGFLTMEEAEVLRPVCSLLADDFRGEIVQYVLCHIDDALTKDIGEGQRRFGVPPARTLIRGGIGALDRCALARYRHHFYGIAEEEQRMMMLELSENRVEPSGLWGNVPQAAFFQKLLTFTVEAYFSHPKVWSEIGYGGPAYPRGYVRTDIGQLDPWEAKRNQ